MKKLFFLFALLLTVGMNAWAQDVISIGTAEELAAFAERVNGGERTINAQLTADVDFTSYPAVEIGSSSLDYDGTFDGQGHKITLGVIREGGTEYATLFRKVGSNGVIKNLITDGTITTDGQCAGGISGELYGRIQDCATYVTINTSVAGDGTHGGITSRTYNGSSIAFCLSAVKIVSKTTTNCGGVAGWLNGSCTFNNNLCVAEFDLTTLNSDGYYSDSFCRNSGNMTSASGNNYFLNYYYAAKASYCTQITKEQLESGEVCYLLNGDQSDIHWYQTIGGDKHPVPFPTSQQVYAAGNLNCAGQSADGNPLTYSNTQSSSIPDHDYVDGICSGCGKAMEKLTPESAVGTIGYLAGREAMVVDLGGDIGKVAIATRNVGATSATEQGTPFNLAEADNPTKTGLTDGWYIPTDVEMDALMDKNHLSLANDGVVRAEWNVTETSALLIPLVSSNASGYGAKYTKEEKKSWICYKLFSDDGGSSLSIEYAYSTDDDQESTFLIRPFHKLPSSANKIYYTSSNDKTVTPRGLFGDAQIVSNEYDKVYGMYCITFDRDITSIGKQAFFNCSNLTSVTIPGSVTSIGEEAFYYCSGLASVTIPNGVTSIGNFAFFDCSGLASVTIPSSVTSIGDYAFNGCSRLASVTIPGSVTSIGKYAFQSCSGLTSVTISNGVTSIGNFAFNGCTRLTTVTIPGSVKSIEKNAFSGCSGLASVTIPGSVTSMGDYAFSGCTGLTSVTISDGVTSIGGYTFSGCTRLTTVTIPSSVTSIGKYAFQSCSGLASVTIPGSVTSMGDCAFSGCTGLTSVTIPGSVTSMGDHAFNGCTGLTSVTISNGVKSIGNNAFLGCSNLTSVTIPGSVTSIGTEAFSGCSSLASVIISDGVTSIGYKAFLGCSNLTSVTIPGSVTSIGNNAFLGCSNLTSVTIPGSVTSIGTEAFSGCSSLASVIISDGVKSIGYKAFLGCSNLTSVTIPGSVTSFGNEAFSGCSSLDSVTISDGVTSIGDNAFLGCFISSFNVSESLEAEKNNYWGAQICDEQGLVIKDNIVICFSKRATSVTIPSGVTGIGNNVFSGCSNLTSVTIPDGLTSIGSNAFEGCSSLTSITLPSSLERMSGGNHFKDCSSLVNANFLGTTPPKWDATYPFGSSGVEVGGTVLFVPDNDAVKSYTAAGYTNVYSSSAPIDEIKSQISDEIAKAQMEVTLAQEVAAIVTACLTNINNATDIEAILQERTAALFVISLQKAKNAAIATIDTKMAGLSEEIKTGLAESIAVWKERINSATTITVVNNELELAKVKIDAIAAIDKTLDDFGSSSLTKEDIESIEECKRNITEATDTNMVNTEEEKAIAIISQKTRNLAKENLRSCYAEVAQYITESDLKPYFDRIDAAKTGAVIDGIVKEAQSAFYAVLSEKLKDIPHIVIGDKWYLIELLGSNNDHKFCEDKSEDIIYFPDGVAYQSDYYLHRVYPVVYTRNLPEGVWQCWYEPFTVYVDTEKFDAAEVAGILINDNDETLVAFKKLKNGTMMNANTVYVIRAKEGQGNLTFNAAYVLLESTETKLTIQSAYENYTLTGNYSPVEHGEWYTLDGTGKFSKMSSGSLKPQRFYLTITPRKDAYYGQDHYNAKAFINIMVLGDEEDVTGIESLAPTLSEGKGVIYDLMGRKVTSIQKGQIYIKDGKKFIAK